METFNVCRIQPALLPDLRGVLDHHSSTDIPHSGLNFHNTTASKALSEEGKCATVGFGLGCEFKHHSH